MKWLGADWEPVAAAGVAVAGLGLVVMLTRPSPLRILDLTAEAPADKRSPRTKPVTGVVLHQMAFQRGPDPRKYTKVTAHYVVTTDGTVARLHPHEAKLPASNSFNSSTVAVEFAGNFPNRDGEWWSPETHGADRPTVAQLKAGRELLRYLHGQGIDHVYAHRQSIAGKGNDPGPEIWANVAEWGIKKLGMSDGGPGFALSEGLPIPAEWRA
jgi:hypothetical protein